ncbi:unnamed protein product [Lampetra fluviatilis]
MKWTGINDDASVNQEPSEGDQYNAADRSRDCLEAQRTPTPVGRAERALGSGGTPGEVAAAWRVGDGWHGTRGNVRTPAREGGERGEGGDGLAPRPARTGPRAPFGCHVSARVPGLARGASPPGWWHAPAMRCVAWNSLSPGGVAATRLARRQERRPLRLRSAACHR